MPAAYRMYLFYIFTVLSNREGAAGAFGTQLKWSERRRKRLRQKYKKRE